MRRFYANKELGTSSLSGAPTSSKEEPTILVARRVGHGWVRQGVFARAAVRDSPAIRERSSNVRERSGAGAPILSGEPPTFPIGIGTLTQLS